ncbi:glutathione S-transferase omega class 1 [Anopheles sinensis]|uniref:Glutathione S-transferase omega class 1 n=1 Tax=Anopheles sinensis TaxID=74873 RepID=A0A084WJL4_ANOSI|nr:glutathione S-transferase omega class 1 [Anopheles sinensis]
MSNGKHLAKGSTAPVLPDDGKLVLYSMRFCPYAQRVHLMLDAKKIPYHTVYINLSEKPEWYFEKNPLGKVPALQVPGKEGVTLYESLVLADYIEEAYSAQQRKLYPIDPFRKAQDRILIERFNGVITAYYRILFSTDGIPPGAITEFGIALDVFEKELKSRGTAYFGGDKPGMIDYMIWPWCERVDLLKFALGDKYELDKERFGKLLQWRDLMEKDEAVKQSFISTENHTKFLQSRKNGENNYDILA